MTEIFLKIDPPIHGESLDMFHQQEIEVHDWSWGITNDAPLKMTGKEASTHTSSSECVIHKGVDAASSTLMQYCALGTPIDKATLTCRKNDGEYKLKYLVIEFTKAKIWDLQWASEGQEHGPKETIKLKFAHFHVQYKRQRNKGSSGGVHEFGFDLPEHEATPGPKK
jgi:type VI secretion system secreted protein Hcp